MIEAKAKSGKGLARYAGLVDACFPLCVAEFLAAPNPRRQKSPADYDEVAVWMLKCMLGVFGLPGFENKFMPKDVASDLAGWLGVILK